MRDAPDDETPARAIVLRFSAARGAGAVKLEENGETVDVATPALRRCGLISLEKGGAVQVVARAKDGVKRRQAIWIRPVGS